MALDRLTKIDGGGISTTSDYRVGIITARKFIGPFDGTGGNFTGVITATDGIFSGNVTIGGTLTYEDVTNIDSVGIITAQKDIHVGAGLSVVGVGTFGSLDISGDIDVDGHTNLDNVSIAGVVTATSFVGGLPITNGADNRVITASSASAIQGEANLTFNGSILQVSGQGVFNNAITAKTYIQGLSSNGGLKFYSDGSTSTGVILDTNDHLTPTTNNVSDLGSSSLKWRNIFAKGDLDVDGHTNLDNVSIAGITTGTIFKVPDATDAAGSTNHIAVGDNSDLKLYHDNNGDAYISNATGHLTIRNNTSGKIINLQPKSGANGIIARYEGAAELYYNGVKKFETGDTVNINSNHFEITSGQQLRFDNSNNNRSSEILNTGSSGNSTLAFKTNGGTRWTIDSSGNFIPGTAGVEIGSTSAEIGDVFVADDKKVYLGSNQDLEVYHSSSDNHSYIKESGSGDLLIQATQIKLQDASGNDYLRGFTGGAVYLHNAGNNKFETTSTGVHVTGEVSASQDYPNFRPTLDFNFAATKKLDPRITYQRTGPASFTDEFGKVVLVGDNVPRFDHDPVTRESKGLLIEHSRTNLVEDNTNYTGWTNYSSTHAKTTDVKAPDGSFNAWKVTSTGVQSQFGIYDAISYTANTKYTHSMWLKAGTATRVGLTVSSGTRWSPMPYLVVDLDTGTVNATGSSLSTKLTAYPNGWYLLEATGQFGSNSIADGMWSYTAHTGGFSGNTTAYYYQWGGQAEAGGYATSYIPTSSAAVTRGADFTTLLDDDFTDAISQTEGTFIAEYDNVTNDGYVLSLDGSGGNKIGMVNSNGYQLMGTAGGSSQGTTDNGTLLSGTNRFALAYKVNDTAISINGNTASVDTSYTLPTTTFMSIGHRQYQYDQLGSCIARIMYYPKRLPNSQLKTLSSR